MLDRAIVVISIEISHYVKNSLELSQKSRMNTKLQDCSFVKICTIRDKEVVYVTSATMRKIISKLKDLRVSYCNRPH